MPESKWLYSMKYQKSQIVHKLENYEQFPILGSLGIASNNS